MYWTLEGWGSSCPPENAEEIISRANDVISDYAKTREEDEAKNFSEELWEAYCRAGDIEEAIHCVNKDLWYAVQRDDEDTDWGTGSYDYDKAVEIARRYGNDARIAVIEMGRDPTCINEISAEDF